MDQCPSEVLHQVCNLLDFEEVAALRCVSKSFADIGAEHLITKVRFHCTKESLERLKAIAEHPVLRQHITTVVFEGNILADIPCEHGYAAHYDLEHHQDEKPQPPPKGCSSRERRLFERNLIKFDNEVMQKYRRYRKAYNSQQTLIKSNTYRDAISTSILAFPRLENVSLSTIGRCRHVLSSRFMEQFTLDCAMPMDSDSGHTKLQLQYLIFPNDTPLLNLRNLDAHVISPKIFANPQWKANVGEVFKSLEKIDLNFRMEKNGRHDLDMGVEFCYEELSKGGLYNALAAASNLKRLAINFDDFGYYGSCISIRNILGDTSWPYLEVLDVDCVCATDDNLVAALQNQPALRILRLGFFTLTKGVWPQVIVSFQKNLSLNEFRATGILEDTEQMYSTHHIDVDAYMTDYIEMTLTDVLDMFVCDQDPNMELDEEEAYNPLTDLVFDDPDDLKAEYGIGSDSDMDTCSEMECD